MYVLIIRGCGYQENSVFITTRRFVLIEVRISEQVINLDSHCFSSRMSMDEKAMFQCVLMASLVRDLSQLLLTLSAPTTLIHLWNSSFF